MTVAFIGDLQRGMTGVAGGKGACLNDMVCDGFPAPEGYILCANVFRDFIERNGLAAQIADSIRKIRLDDAQDLEHCSRSIRQLITGAEIPEDLREKIVGPYRVFCGPGENLPVAVRSSSTAEDLPEASFAGQQETFLYVIGEEEMLSRVKECWASIYNARAIFYRHQKGFASRNVDIAVVIQRMIDAEKAGVMFTLNPITKDAGSTVIEAVWGLGEGAVSGLVTPDSYIVRKNTLELEQEFISVKDVMIVRSDSKRGVQEKSVSAGQMEKRVLGSEEIRTLVEYGKNLEKCFGAPQDVEWAIEKGRVYLLQSRPVTCV